MSMKYSFCLVWLDMGQRRISFLWNRITLFVFQWHGISFFFWHFIKLFMPTIIQEFMSNIQIVMHDVLLKVSKFIFPTYGFFSGMIHINQSMQMYIQQIIMVLCILYNGSLYAYNRLSNASFIIIIANKFILLYVFFL